MVDFIQPRYPNLNQQEILKYGRIVTFILMIIAALWAPMIENFGGLWMYLQQMYTIFVPPIVVLFLVGVFDKKGNNGAFMTLVLGTFLGISLVLHQTNVGLFTFYHYCRDSCWGLYPDFHGLQ